MKKIVVINCVGLVPRMIGDLTPNLLDLRNHGSMAAMKGILPGLTCSAQSTMLTGKMPSEHGIVGNGWYFRELAEVMLWRQNNGLVQADKIWDIARQTIDKDFKVCNMFWWYNMYSGADYSVTPRPLYFADGKKLPGIYASPPEFWDQVARDNRPFPLFNFWGPAANIASTNWIAEISAKSIRELDNHLTLVYVPHLDYDLQRFGPDLSHPQVEKALRDLDAALTPILEAARDQDSEVFVVSEYGLQEVNDAVHINRVLREAGFLATSPMLDTENFDAGASRAFAVADHQIAHVYVKSGSDLEAVTELLSATPGIAQVLNRQEMAPLGLDHPRSGELLALAESDRWFSYYFWLDDQQAPDYARTVDIHRKPGYDPVELFLDPKIAFPKLKIAGRVIQKKLGMRMLMDVIPLDASLVRGSHGLMATDPQDGPIIMSSCPMDLDNFAMTDLVSTILSRYRA